MSKNNNAYTNINPDEQTERTVENPSTVTQNVLQCHPLWYQIVLLKESRNSGY